MDRLRFATAFGFEDAFLYAVDMLFELAPGQLVPTFTLEVKRWLFLRCASYLPYSHTSSCHETVPTSAYPLVSQGHWLLRQSYQGLADGFLLVVSTCNECELESSLSRSVVLLLLWFVLSPGRWAGEVMILVWASSRQLAGGPAVASLPTLPFGQVYPV